MVMDMYKICVAGINILIGGADCPLFSRRLSEYGADFKKADICVEYEIKSSMARPEGKTYPSQSYRRWAETGSGFAIYDLLGGERVSALIEANGDFSAVRASLCDIEPLGGASIPVRAFNMLGEIFRCGALVRERCVIHASAVSLNGVGAAFSAPSGAGKSTHAALWEKYFGARVINDDSPAIGLENGGAVIYGTPWSGKSEKNSAVSAPLKAVFFLRRAEKAALTPLPDAEKAFRLISQLPVPPAGDFAELYARFAERLIKNVPMYILDCDISREAAEAAKKIIL